MQYKIIGDNLPAVVISLQPGETIQCESGSMSWMDNCIKMETKTGGLGKMFGRMVSGESLALNHYTAEQAGDIAFASSFPGSIVAIQLNGNSIMCQKGAFLAMYGDVEMSVGFQKRIGGGFFGGEGFIMQKFTGNGTVFLEVDGSAVEYDLAPGEVKIVDTGYVVMMDSSVTLDVQMVKGVANVLLGGEGLFNTTLTGPGHITLQTMPVSKTAAVLYAAMPHKNN
ncbi:MAG: TIGR00266 family protein [Saccharofermentans sp.]|nr:TIGR00266 family protein [Saccharofermentans sp.]